MKKILFALSLVLCLNAQANSIADWFATRTMSIEASVGHTLFQKAKNGIWWQNPFPHSFDTQSNSFSLGLSDYAFGTTRWRVEYTRLGNISSDALGVSDANYNGANGCIGPCDPFGRFRTESSVRGVAFALDHEISLTGQTRLLIGGGAVYNLPKFYAEAAACESCAVTWRNEYREGWQWGSMVSIGIEHDKTALIVTRYKLDAPTGDPNAIVNYGNKTWNLKLRQRF